MAKFLATTKKVPQHLPHGTAPRGFKGFLTDKGERAALAFAFGAAKGYYYKKFMVKGVPADMLIGGAAWLVSAYLDAGSNGNSKMAEHLERIGDAGVSSYLNSMGASWGAKKAGRVPPILGGRSTVLGYISPAVAGAYLSPDEIANFAARR